VLSSVPVKERAISSGLPQAGKGVKLQMHDVMELYCINRLQPNFSPYYDVHEWIAGLLAGSDAWVHIQPCQLQLVPSMGFQT
jgi:hypothetical protein